MGSNLNVQGNSVFNSNIYVSNNLNVNGDFFINNVSLCNLIKDVIATSQLQTINDITFSNNVTIFGSLSLFSNLNVQGIGSFNSNVTIAGTTTLGSNVIVLGDALINSNLTVLGISVFNSNLNVNGSTLIGSNLGVLGDVSVQGNSTFNSNIYVSNNLNVNGDFFINNVSLCNLIKDVIATSQLQTINEFSFSNNVTIYGSLSLFSNLSVTGLSTLGDVSVNSNLNVQGTGSFDSNVTIIGSTLLGSNVGVLGDVLMNSNLTVQGIATFKSNVGILGNTSLSSNLNVQGTGSFSSNVTIIGSTLLGSNVEILGNTSLSSNLNVIGSTSLGSNLGVLGNVSVQGNSTFNSNIYVSNNLNVNGDFFINNVSLCNLIKDVIATSQLQTINEFTFSNNVTIYGSLSLLSNLSVTGLSTFTSNVGILGGVSILGSTNLASNLGVLGNVVLSSNLNVQGGSLFDSNVAILGNTYLSSNLQVSGISSFQTVNILSNLNVSGELSINNMSLSNYISSITGGGSTSNIYIAGNAYLSNNIIVQGTGIFKSNLNVLGDLFINNVSLSNLIRDIVAQTNFTFSNLSVSGSLDVKGSSTFQSNVEILGNTRLSSNLSVQGSLTTVGDVSFSNKLTVKGTSTFQSNVSMLGQVNLKNVHYDNGATTTYHGDMIHFNDYDIIYTGTGSVRFDQDVTIKNLNLEDKISVSNIEFLGGLISFGMDCSNIKVWSNIPDTEYGQVHSSFIVDSNLYVGCNLYIGGKLYCNGFTMFNSTNAVLGNLTVYESMTLCNTYVDGVLILGHSNKPYIVYSNIPDTEINEVEGTLVVDSNLYVGGRIYCNGLEWSSTQSMHLYDSVFYGTATFCNTTINGALKIGNSNKPTIVYSNITESNIEEVNGALKVDSNLYVGGMIYCNGVQWSSVNNQHLYDAVIHGHTTFCNWHVAGKIEFGNSGEYTTFSNIPNSNLNTFESAVLIDEDLYVKGKIFCNGFSLTAVGSGGVRSNINISFSNVPDLTVTNTFKSKAHLNFFECGMSLQKNISFFDKNVCPYSDPPSWTAGIKESYRSNAHDFVFKSKNGTTVTFTDNFTSEILNFTGKHRCSSQALDLNNINEHIGKIVIASGKYKGLDGTSNIQIDESIPIISIASKANDKRVFGVICGTEETGDSRKYKLGNLQFEHEKQDKDTKVVVNSVGEGAILICNINGDFENGDLITSSDIPGFGMKQDSDLVRSFTVAKITCDCNFKNAEEFEYQGKIYRKCLVGCVYKV